MNFFGNLLWLLFGGLLTFILYCVDGLLLCCTIIGIPFGIQLWRLGFLALCPFGKQVTNSPSYGCLPAFFNVLWVLLGWWEIALVHLVFALLCGITIIGIPFAKQHLKLIRLSLMPFGTTIASA